MNHRKTKTPWRMLAGYSTNCMLHSQSWSYHLKNWFLQQRSDSWAHSWCLGLWKYLAIVWNTLLTHLKVFCPSYGPLIIGPEPKNQTSIASINSGVDSLDFANVAVSLWNTLLTHLKVFWPSYGLLIIGPEPKNQTFITSMNCWLDGLWKCSAILWNILLTHIK